MHPKKGAVIFLKDVQFSVLVALVEVIIIISSKINNQFTVELIIQIRRISIYEVYVWRQCDDRRRAARFLHPHGQHPQNQR